MRFSMQYGIKIAGVKPVVVPAPTPPPSRWRRFCWFVSDYWLVFVWGCAASLWLQLVLAR